MAVQRNRRKPPLKLFRKRASKPGLLADQRLLKRLRQRARLIPFPEDLELPHEDPEPADDALARRVDALPPEVGTVIKLRFYEEMTLKEIGEVTGQNISTVKSRLYAGLRKLRVAMEGVEI